MIDEKLLKNEELAVYRLRELYSGFGYTQYKMSKFEEYDLYVKNKDFLISDRIITFTDTNGKLLALKPDVTLSIINNFGKDVNGIHKMYYNENVYRVSGGTGKFKEIMQTGLECIGDIGIYEITEVVYLALESLKLTDDRFTLEISHAGLLEQLIEDACFSETVKEIFIQCIKIKNSGQFYELLKKGEISEKQFRLAEILIENYTSVDKFFEACSDYAVSAEAKNCLNEFINILNSVCNEAFEKHIIINFSLSGESGYYSGIVFKGYINGIPSSVLSGGQYDKLLRKLGSQAGAVGFAVYLDNFERFKITPCEYDVDTVLIKGEGDNPAEIFATVEKLKAKGERVLVLSQVPADIRYRRIIGRECE